LEATNRRSGTPGEREHWPDYAIPKEAGVAGAVKTTPSCAELPQLREPSGEQQIGHQGKRLVLVKKHMISSLTAKKDPSSHVFHSTRELLKGIIKKAQRIGNRRMNSFPKAT
jgi:hypothetical protein